MIDSGVADKEDFAIGDEIGVQVEGPVERLRISGIVEFGSDLSIGGATLAGFDLPTAQRLFEKEGRLDEIAVAAKQGVSDQQLLSEIEPILPPNAQARTGQAQAQEDAAETNEFITFLQGFLLAFGGIALFVGAFVIANSLSITIAQRTREFATLRTLGASRRQVMISIFVEALVVGVVASVIGLFLGLLLASGLFSLFDAVGFTLPNTGLLFETRTVVVALLAGILVTLFASLRPALRATRVPPDRRGARGCDAAPGPLRALPRDRRGADGGRRVRGAALRALRQRPRDDADPHLDGPRRAAHLPRRGAASRRGSCGPLAHVLGWPATRFGGAAGLLARDNSRRNPQRTASTASALMIGLALVTLVATLAAGIVNSFRGAVNDLFTGDYAITAQNNFSPIPISAAEAAAQAPGVTAVGSVRTGEVARLRLDRVRHRGRPGDEGGHLDGLGRGLAGHPRDARRRRRLHGRRLREGPRPSDRVADPGHVPERRRRRTFRLRGIFDPPSGGSPFGTVTVSAAAWDAEVQRPKNLYSFVKMEGGATDANQAALDAALADFPNAKAQDRETFIDNQIAGLSAILNILYVLLALSIVVSLFGIVNTLVLTVFERTREIGMLRAIGMTRRQIRRMIRHESVITVAHRGGDRDRARDRARGAPHRARRLHRVLVPDDAGDRVRDRGDPRRGPGGDLPGAACREAQPARSPALRIGDWHRRCLPRDVTACARGQAPSGSDPLVVTPAAASPAISSSV